MPIIAVAIRQAVGNINSWQNLKLPCRISRISTYKQSLKIALLKIDQVAAVVVVQYS